MIDNYYDLETALQRATEDIILLSITMSLWAFLFGILMEWNGLRSLFKGEFNVNWQLLIPTVVLTILVFIPNVYWLTWFGQTQDFFPNVFFTRELNLVLSVLAGTMLVRSFVKK
ncbi:hypothetical protein FHR85_002005 [Alkalibacillus almallahensis]|nr:hypothetical protein [Alkalibacillus almallahensis]